MQNAKQMNTNSAVLSYRLPAVDNSLGPPSVVMKLDVEGRFKEQHDNDDLTKVMNIGLTNIHNFCLYCLLTRHQRMVCVAFMTHAGPARARHKSSN